MTAAVGPLKADLEKEQARNKEARGTIDRLEKEVHRLKKTKCKKTFEKKSK